MSLKMPFEILKKFQSVNFDNRSKNAKIKYIILHFTETKDLAEAINILCDKNKKVSSHYVIDYNGKIYQLVPDNKRAWHAGISFWRKDRNLNDLSLGVEIVNKGEKLGHCFPDLQIKQLIKLIKHLSHIHKISYNKVLGHSDIAPTRKIDPGILFPWKKLDKYSIGLPFKKFIRKEQNFLDKKEIKQFLQNLHKIGYFQADPKKGLVENNLLVINAFHRHFYPEFINEQPTRRSLEISNFLIKKSFKNI